jgi:4-hydroxybenzoate polyprenyltransferase
MQIRALAALPFLCVSGYLLYLEQKKSHDVEMAFFKINAILGFAVLAMVLIGVYFP